MIQSLANIFIKIKEFGILPSDSLTEKKHIALTNLFLLAYISVLLVYVPFLLCYIQFTKSIIILVFLEALCLGFCLILCSKRFFSIAKFLGLTTGTTFLFCVFLLIGRETYVALYCLAILPFSFVMFKKSETKLLIVSVLYLAICYLIIQLNLFQLKPIIMASEVFIYQFKLINIIFSISSALILTGYNYGTIFSFESSLLEINQRTLEQKQIAETHKFKIDKSINYSKHFQTALIPSKSDLQKYFKDSLLLFNPKDVVSGDFPWLQHREGYTYIAAVDCTGHGVPGAMLSVIGNLLLNDIVKSGDHLKTPSEILNELHDALVQTLKQTSEEDCISDGMDIALCRVSPDQSELLFSGAYRPLYLMDNGILRQFKGNKFPIGGTQYRTRTSFKDHIIPLAKGNSVYMFSDGYQDQFGGEKDKKIGVRRLRQLLVEHNLSDMSVLNDTLIGYFNSWKGNEEQIDDVLIIGIKF